LSYRALFTFAGIWTTFNGDGAPKVQARAYGTVSGDTTSTATTERQCRGSGIASLVRHKDYLMQSRRRLRGRLREARCRLVENVDVTVGTGQHHSALESGNDVKGAN
jgi:hypothetical protein